MSRMLRRTAARFRALLGSDASSARQGMAALLVSSGGDLLAGLTLGAITGTLNALPGLLVLVPAAIGMRGNIFGALGSRLGTAIHTGTFSLSRRTDTVVGQNIVASLALTLSISLALAILAKAVSIGFGLTHTISVADFVVISVVGGAISSVFVLLLTLGVAAASVRHGWDLDNVAAPLVTAAAWPASSPSAPWSRWPCPSAWLGATSPSRSCTPFPSSSWLPSPLTSPPPWPGWPRRGCSAWWPSPSSVASSPRRWPSASSTTEPSPPCAWASTPTTTASLSSRPRWTWWERSPSFSPSFSWDSRSPQRGEAPSPNSLRLSYTEAAAMDDRPRNLKTMLSEAKDTSELMVDLAYAALYFGDPDMAEEVEELEETLSELVHEMRAVCVLAARSPKDADAMASVLQVASAIESMGNSAVDFARIFTHRLGIPRALVADLSTAEEISHRVRVRDGSQMAHRALSDLELPIEVGMRVVAIRREHDWITDVEGDEVLLPGDVMFLQGAPAGIAELRKLAGAPEWEPPQPPEDAAVDDLDRAIDTLVEMKNVSEVAIGLAYSAPV